MATSVTVPRPEASRRSRLLAALAAAGCGTGAALSAVTAPGGKLAILWPVAIGAAVIMGFLAMTRFAAYVYLVLLLRASLELTRLTDESLVARLLTPPTLLAVLFIIAGALWLTAQYRARRLFPGSGLRRSLVIFLAAAAVSVVGASHPLASVASVLQILAAVLMFAVLEQLMMRRETMKRLLGAVFLSAVFPLLYTTAGFMAGDPPVHIKGDITRVAGTFSNANSFGRYLMLILIVGIAVHPRVRGRLRVGFTALLGLSAVLLVTTYTLTAIVGVLLGLLVIGLMQNKRVLLGVLVAVTVATLLAPPLTARLVAVTGGEASIGAGPYGGDTLAWRLNHWTGIASLANESPLAGIGLGMTVYDAESGTAPHNDYLRAYVETGVVGLAAYLALICMLLRTGLLAARAPPPRSFERSVAVGFLGCAVAFAGVSLGANVITDVVLLWYFVVFAAAASAIRRRVESGEAPAEAAEPRP